MNKKSEKLAPAPYIGTLADFVRLNEIVERAILMYELCQNCPHVHPDWMGIISDKGFS